MLMGSCKRLISLPNFAIANNNLSFRNSQILSTINQCSSSKQLKQVHAQMLRTGLFFDPFSASQLFTASALSSFSTLDYARQVFDQIPQPNLYTWNTLIRAYASSSDPFQSFVIFQDLLEECDDSPNNFTFTFVIKAASEVKASRVGRVVHGMAIKMSFGMNLYILNSLVRFYGACGALNIAERLFEGISNKTVVSWNSMISAFVLGDCPENALDCFLKMEGENVMPDSITMVGVLSACGKKLDLEFGRWVCSYIERKEIEVDLTLCNAILDMYVKCGSVVDAQKVFDEMPERDVFTWITMLEGYAKTGDFDAARQVFDAMPVKEIAAWNVLISAYEKNGKPKEALATFKELQLSKIAEPDEVTLVSTLSACSQLGAIDLGGWIHMYIKSEGIVLNCHLITSLVDMYAKCGVLEKALEVFYSVEERDVYIWNAMIAGLGTHGRGKAAIELFFEMQELKVKPNDVTFTNILCACSFAGLVDEGRAFFHEMEPVYGVVPGTKHYACMVDILGRAGLLEEAMELINEMPVTPGASVWGVLLGACILHMNVELAELASDQLFKLEPKNHGAIVNLSNIYAKTRRWDKVSELRKLMRDSELKKEPGCSFIEVNGNVHEFLVGDNSHPLSREIYSKLDEIATKLISVGYVPNKSHLLQLVEEDDLNEQALSLHSEKLAIAFGLISLAPSQPIRVVKNLRICGDCHEVAKLISRIYARDILLRDRYQFHHFRDGHCSCMDYW